MKFLVLALCFAAANAASFGTGFPRPSRFGSVASAKAFVDNTPVVKSVPVVPVAVPVVPVPVRPVPVPARTVPVSSSSDVDAPILRSESDVKPDGFNYAYETGNGIAAEATGNLKRVEDSEVVAHVGSYRYTSPEGVPVVINYIADENGFQPQGDLLPVAPPVPEAILRSIRYINEHPTPVETVRRS